MKLLLILLLLSFIHATSVLSTEEFFSNCNGGRHISAACCAAIPPLTVEIDAIDSIYLEPRSCAVPPFCASTLPMTALDEGADTYCPPSPTDDGADLSYIICKVVDRRFTCYGRGATSTIDFSRSPETPCRIDIMEDVPRVAIHTCRVNVRTRPIAVGDPAISSAHPLTFRPILRPELVPWRTHGPVRVLLRADVDPSADVPLSRMAFDALMPEDASDEMFAQFEDSIVKLGISHATLALALIVFVIWVGICHPNRCWVSNKTSKLKLRIKKLESHLAQLQQAPTEEI